MAIKLTECSSPLKSPTKERKRGKPGSRLSKSRSRSMSIEITDPDVVAVKEETFEIVMPSNEPPSLGADFASKIEEALSNDEFEASNKNRNDIENAEKEKKEEDEVE